MSGWTPSNLKAGKLHVWFKADSVSGSDGDSVASWSDSSGNGNTASQATSARQPTLQTNELNGQSVLEFDGTNDILSDGDVADLDVGTGDIWFAAVFKSTSNGAVQFFFEKQGTSLGLMSTKSGTLAARLGGASNIPQQNNGNWSRTSHILVTASRVSSTCNGFYNGSAMDTTGTTNTGSIDNSSVLDIGAAAVGGQPMLGQIAEVLIGGATLRTKERLRIEGYLADKYGLKGNIPTAHIYKVLKPAFGLMGMHNQKLAGDLDLDLNGNLVADELAGAL